MINTHYRGWVQTLVFPMQLGADETYEWVTDIQTSYNGNEYRSSLRGIPRKKIVFEVFTKDLDTVKSFVHLYRNFTDKWAVPMWMDAVKLGGNITLASTGFTLSDRNFWFHSESIALIYSSPTKWEVVDVLSYDGQSFTLYAPTTYSHTNPTIIPLAVGRLRGAGRDNYKKYSVNKLVLEVEDNFIPVYEILDDNEWEQVILVNSEDYYTNSTINVFAGVANQGNREILSRSINSGSGSISDNNLEGNVLLFDNIRGLRQQISTWNNPKIGKDFNFVVSGRRNIDYVRTWLFRAGGRYKELWIPSHGNKLNVTSPTITNQIDVVNFTDSIRKHIGIHRNDGLWFFSQITTKQDMGGGVTRITLSDNFNGLSMSQVNQVVYAGIHRLDEDTITIKWVSNAVATVSLPMKEIEG